MKNGLFEINFSKSYADIVRVRIGFELKKHTVLMFNIEKRPRDVIVHTCEQCVFLLGIAYLHTHP